ncbi:hypothetical protein BZA77DRAFT_378813 [Pyronema omphalodes]|nr:hypothetical protein BZA77DRAFT_378813 [Pyronema omphalodes]
MQFSILLSVLALGTSTLAAVLPPSEVSITRIKDRLSHLDAYRSSHRLTDDQSYIIDWAVSFITSLERSEDELNSLEEAAIEVFGKEQARAIFVDLNEEANSQMEVKGDAAQPVCQCSSKSSYCGNGEGCARGASGCKQRTPGCGFLFARTCDGLCVKV